ncbi:MAG: hypothetical protein OEL89_01910 [Candidatus Peregrinibacteria bacterium]|nr:hypothetical protein [Candidatus Peregrinibacteria bacterium]
MENLQETETEKLMIGIPTGSMKDAVLNLLLKAGYEIPKKSKLKIIKETIQKLKSVFEPSADIGRKLDLETLTNILSRVDRKFRNAELLADGTTDIAIGTDDYFLNSGFSDDIAPIGESMVLSRNTRQLTKIVLAGNQETAKGFKPEKLRGKIIATEMWRLAQIQLMKLYGFSEDDFVILDNDPNVLKISLDERNKRIENAKKDGKIILRKSDGGTEATIVPDGKGETVADFCIEITETGTSMIENDLKILATIFESGVNVFIARSQIENKKILNAAIDVYVKMQTVLARERGEEYSSGSLFFTPEI